MDVSRELMQKPIFHVSMDIMESVQRLAPPFFLGLADFIKSFPIHHNCKAMMGPSPRTSSS
jgi:hypothetical protein